MNLKEPNLLTPSFFDNETISIAKNLIGCTLIHKTLNGTMGGIICETEAYTQDDPACHAYQGKKTKRNHIMFKSAGHIYIYFIYGMYFCLNIVTEKEGTGAAVLIRGVIPTIGVDLIKQNRPKIKSNNQLCNGPGKLVLGLDISPNLNSTFLHDASCPIKLYERHNNNPTITEHPRIGISEARDRLWRFLLT